MMPYVYTSLANTTYSGLDLIIAYVALLVGLFVAVFFLAEVLREGSVEEQKTHHSMHIHAVK